MPPLRALLLSTAALSLLAGCGDGSRSTDPEETPDVTVTLSVESVRLVVGATTRVTASVRDEAGRPAAGAQVTLAVDDTAVAAVDAGGVVTARRIGSTSLTATTDGASRSIPLVVAAGSFDVAGPPVRVHVGRTVNAAALVFDPDQRATNAPVTYAIEDQTVAEVSAAGIVTGRAAGTTRLLLAGGGAQAARSVVVPQPPKAAVVASRPFPCASGVAFAPGGAGLVLSQCAGTLALVDAAAATVSAPISVGGTLLQVAFDPTGARAYVAHQDPNGVRVIDVATGAPTAAIPLGASNMPVNVVVSPDGGRVYVAARHDASFRGKLIAIDAATGTVVDSVDVDDSPVGLAHHPTQPIVYVGSFLEGTIAAIDMGTKTVVRTYTIPGMLQRMAVTADGTKLYVADENRFVHAVTLATGATTPISFPFVAYDVALAPDGDYAYVSHPRVGSVTVLDVVAGEEHSSVALPPPVPPAAQQDPRVITVAPDGTVVLTDNNGRVYFIR